MMRHKYVAARPGPREAGPRMGPRRWAYHEPVRPHSTLGVFLRRLVAVSVIALALLLVVAAGYKLWIDMRTRDMIYEQGDTAIPNRHVALVFGAGLNRRGGPSRMLYDRVATAADLYIAGKVNKLLMTGDNTTANHNEVEAMRQTAVELGVAGEDIVLDYAGLNTWDSCYRAREIFSLEEAILVTQRFHLPRALHTCNELGVEAIGVVADRQPYRTFTEEAREYFAIAGTGVRFLINDKPRFLGPKVNIPE